MTPDLAGTRLFMARVYACLALLPLTLVGCDRSAGEPVAVEARWVLCASAADDAPDDDDDDGACEHGEISREAACQRYWSGEDGALLGLSVAALGDLDEDEGLSFAISAPGACGGRGAAFLFTPWAEGAPDSGTTPLTEARAAIVAADSDALTSFESRPAFTAEPAGDANADGIGDLLALSGDPQGAYLLLGPFEGERATGDADAALTGNGAWPRAIAPAGDQDDDGLADFAVANRGDDGSGEVLVFPGSSRGALTSATPLARIGPRPDGDTWARMGEDLAGGEDLDGDGVPDLVAVVWNGDDSYVAVFAGPVVGELTTADAMGRVIGEPSHSRDLGSDVAFAGDVDGDGVVDLLVGDEDWAAEEDDWDGGGAVALFAGPLSGDVSFADATAGVTASRWYDALGRSVDGAGDIDGDGFGDVLIGAPNHGWDTDTGEDLCTGPGAAWVFRGPLAGQFDEESAAASVRGTYEGVCGATGGDSAGAAVAGAGDVNADGFADLLVGGPGYAGEDEGMDAYENDNRGLAWLVLGAPF